MKNFNRKTLVGFIVTASLALAFAYSPAAKQVWPPGPTVTEASLAYPPGPGVTDTSAYFPPGPNVTEASLAYPPGPGVTYPPGPTGE